MQEAATNAVRRFLAGTRMPEDAAEPQQLSPSSPTAPNVSAASQEGSHA